MKNTKLLLVLLLFLMTGKVMAQEPTVKPLMSKDLTESPGKSSWCFWLRTRALRC